LEVAFNLIKEAEGVGMVRRVRGWARAKREEEFGGDERGSALMHEV
jgi:hypothetical protein